MGLNGCLERYISHTVHETGAHVNSAANLKEKNVIVYKTHQMFLILLTNF
jgi:hypothetical protein